MTTVPLPPRRAEMSTADPAEAREILDRMYGGRLVVGGPGDSGWTVSLRQVSAAGIDSTIARLPADLTFEVTGRDHVVINTILGGTIGFDRPGAEDRYQAGDVQIAIQPGARFTCRTHATHAHTLALPQSLLSRVASTGPGPPRGPVTFTSAVSSRDGTRQWRQATRYADKLLASPETATWPLLAASAAQMLAATALAVFPNTAFYDPTIEDRHDAHPATLRRAVAFIDENAHDDISVADIADAAFVTVRAVQLAFRRHLDTTPLDYLRRVRLGHAHRDLLAADPARTTVTAVAHRWGFPSPSRFTAYYRKAYGIAPGRTLRS